VAEAVVRLRVDASGATRALNGVQNQTNKLQNTFNGLRNAIAVSGIGLIGAQAVKTSANFDKLNVRLGLLTKQSGTFAKSQQIAADAQKAFGLSSTEALEGITDITARLAPLGVGVEDIKSTFFGFNTAAKLAGASTIEASNAFRQLAQALGSGRLAGDEFRSISEQIPTLLQPIATELNVPIGKLKELAAEGKLTSEVVLRALRQIETDGAASLKALVANDPTQIFKNFSNATHDLQKALGDELRPAVESVTKLLTKLINEITAFVKTDAGQAAILIGKIAVAVKLLSVAIPIVTGAFSALLVKINMVGAASLIASGGFTGMQAASLLAAGGIGKVTLALGALKIAIATTGIGALVLAVGGLATVFMKARREAKEFARVVAEGSGEEVKNELVKQEEALRKIDERLAKAKGRAEKALERQRKQIQLDIEALEQREQTLEKEKEITEEKEKQNEEAKKAEEAIKKQDEAAAKLKERFMEIGKSVEEGIVQNLTDAVMGTKSLAEAAKAVLDDLKRQLIELAMQQAVSGLGNFIGNALGSVLGGFGGGGGGGLPSSQALGKAASVQTGIPMKLPEGAFNITGKLAKGGPVTAGGNFLVGEKGPEIFTPSRGGTIIPNKSLGGQSIVNNININVDASGTSVQSDEDQGNEFGERLASAVQAVIVNEKRVGGLLA